MGNVRKLTKDLLEKMVRENFTTTGGTHIPLPKVGPRAQPGFEFTFFVNKDNLEAVRALLPKLHPGEAKKFEEQLADNALGGAPPTVVDAPGAPFPPITREHLTQVVQEEYKKIIDELQDKTNNK